jgi:uncharacterized protein (TIGR03067 family)
MKHGLLTALALSFLLAADQPANKDKDVKQELDKLQGTWQIASLEIDGNPVPAEFLKEARIIIKGDKFESRMGVTYTGTVKIDPTQKPKTIDLVFESGPEKGNTSLGIYELDGDTWRICLGVTAKERPKEFATKAGSGLALEKLTREKK